MTITLYQDRDFRGRSLRAPGDRWNLRNADLNNPSSIRLERDDAILLFTRRDWYGDCLYINGEVWQNVDDLGDLKTGFRNGVTSCRTTPFRVGLNVNVVQTSDGRLPGRWTSQARAQADLAAVVSQANDFLRDRRALLQLDLTRVRFRTSDKDFDLSTAEALKFPKEWKDKGEVDIVVVDRFTKDGVGGGAHPPMLGETVIVAASSNPATGPDRPLGLADMAFVLVHELGHYFGLSHNSANDQPRNVMFESYDGEGFTGKFFVRDQIEEMHKRLANHISRRGDRAE